MRQDLYLQFLSLNFKRRKSEAKARLIDFIDSFQSDGEIREWVRNFLESGEHGYQIQYELYERLIFPELLSGYKRNDAWSVLWLANTVVNLYANPDLHLQIGNIGERELLSKAFACIPTEELRERLLFNYLHSFSYCEHDWPAGIVIFDVGANEADCNELLAETEVVRTLDDGMHAQYLSKFESRVREWMGRIKNSSQLSGRQLEDPLPNNMPEA